ncbi:hypothetical protein K2173_026670 [Erythroxylum novogranatense]|uniref:DUF4005 domain-containing protein n=1 Tax=Erythroxylum novogranatense TaxID=1862640 RepID=A0AAV8TX79_9ROSI|nr:hypothetical protein K2173_026670 [Erythroxylum novogranatense]
MGFFRRIFGAKKAGTSSPSKEKKRWSFSRSSSTAATHKAEPFSNQFDDNLDASKHAIAVAAAAATAAEAALAAAQAAAEVVRLTSAAAPPATTAASGNRPRRVVEPAAVMIQSAFRGYLARRALRALKALVKLQALVRGHIVRKQTADMLRRMQTLVRVQARARATRSSLSESWRSASKSSRSHYTRCGSSSNLGDIIGKAGTKFGSDWLERWMEESLWNNEQTPARNRCADDHKNDKILEVDTWKPQVKAHVLGSHYNHQNFTVLESPLKMPPSSIKLPAENSPRPLSASSRPGSSCRRSPFTPTKSECMFGYFNGYSSYPNYMANTESYRAKVRSQSAPRQRLYSASGRSFQGFGDADNYSERSFVQNTSFRSRGYVASGRLHRLRSVSTLR